MRMHARHAPVSRSAASPRVRARRDLGPVRPGVGRSLGDTPGAVSQRLQHARTAIEAFTRAYCGLASDSAACACHRRVPAALRLGRVHPDAINFAQQPSSYLETRGFVRRAEQARWALQVHRTSQPRASAVEFARRLAQSLDSPRDPAAHAGVKRAKTLTTVTLIV
jgi:hypothetical protein